MVLDFGEKIAEGTPEEVKEIDVIAALGGDHRLTSGSCARQSPGQDTHRPQPITIDMIKALIICSTEERLCARSRAASQVAGGGLG